MPSILLRPVPIFPTSFVPLCKDNSFKKTRRLMGGHCSPGQSRITTPLESHLFLHLAIGKYLISGAEKPEKCGATVHVCRKHRLHAANIRARAPCGSVVAPPASSAGGRWPGKRWGAVGALVLAGQYSRPTSPGGVNGTANRVLAVQPRGAAGDHDAAWSCHSSGRSVARHGRGKATIHR